MSRTRIRYGGMILHFVKNSLTAEWCRTRKNCLCRGSTLGADCLPVDKDGHPLRKAILYGIDARCVEEMEYLSQYYGTEKVKNYLDVQFAVEMYLLKFYG